MVELLKLNFSKFPRNKGACCPSCNKTTVESDRQIAFNFCEYLKNIFYLVFIQGNVREIFVSSLIKPVRRRREIKQGSNLAPLPLFVPSKTR